MADSPRGRGATAQASADQEPSQADRVVLKSDPLLALRVSLAGTPPFRPGRQLNAVETFSLRRSLLSLARLTRDPQAAQHVVRTGGAAALSAGAMFLCS